MYESLSLFYDDYMADVDYNEWASYLKEILKLTGVYQGEILEFGCGSASLSIPLSEDFKVSGVDLSEEMLTLAEQKAREKNVYVDLYLGDMKTFNLGRKVDAVVCACDTTNYLTPDEVKTFFKNVYHHLKPGGVFLFDVVTEHYLRDFIAQRPFIYETDDLFFVWTSQIHEDRIDYHFTFFIKDGSLYKRIDEEQTEWILSEKFLNDSLRQTGFQTVTCYNFLELSNPGAETERIQFLAVKNNGKGS